MAKKKETIQDILDRINEDIEAIRDKVEELENHECDSDEDFEDEDEDEDEQIIKKDSQSFCNSGYLNKSNYLKVVPHSLNQL